MIDIKNKVKHRKAGAATKTPSNGSLVDIKMKVVAQHSSYHNPLYIHQANVMNQLIHLTHNEDSNRESLLEVPKLG